MLNPNIQEILNGFTSDHCWRSVSVQIRDNQGGFKLELRGATWNMMDQAQQASNVPGKKRIAHSNNPCGATETVAEYKARRMAQIDELNAILKCQQPKELDFIFLQEADWAQPGPSTLDNTVKVARNEIKVAFEKMLKANGFAMVISENDRNDPNHATQQALVTLYNTKTLTHSGSVGAFPLRSVDPVSHAERVRNRAYQTNFTHNSTNMAVCLTNLHLDFDHDYTAEIDAYLAERTRLNQVTIMGGDTNHPQNEGIQQLIVDWHRPSNVTDTSKEPNNNDDDEDNAFHLVASDRRDRNKLKSYDGFCVAPTSNTYAVITEEKGKYFETARNGKSCTAREYEPSTVPNYQHKHSTMIGRPWKRTIYLLKDLDEELGKESDPIKRKELFAKLQSAAIDRLQVSDLHSDKRTMNLLYAIQYKAFSELLIARGYTGSIPRIRNSKLLDGSPKSTIDLMQPNFLVAFEFADSGSATAFVNHFGLTKKRQGINQNIISFTARDLDKMQLSASDKLNDLFGPLLPLSNHAPDPEAASSSTNAIR